MSNFDRIYRIDQLLRLHPRRYSKKEFCEELECSENTIDRDFQFLRDRLGAPLTYDRQRNGYFYQEQHGLNFQLPGLWFSASELQALLIAHNLLKSAEPNILHDHLNPLQQRIEQLLDHTQPHSKEMIHRVRFVSKSQRHIKSQVFQICVSALIQRQQLSLIYQARTSGASLQRDVSPQRLVHYQNNWYLDVYCHLRDELRTFSIDRIVKPKPSNQQCVDIEEQKLETHFTSSFGLYSGEATETAILIFSTQQAQWVAEEQWHPQQKSKWRDDGSYELHIPYKHPQELIMDILKYGAEVEVIAPQSLREQIENTIKTMKKIYQS